MKHYGDITKISGYDIPLVDIVCGGSPCQDLSVAGRRAGLAGERSGLFIEQIRIIKEMRERSVRDGSSNDDIRPRYMVWENVTGAFSSNKGEDFRAVLEETAKVVDKNAVIPGLKDGKWTPCGCIVADGWSIAWRTHDAQFWGVPQRRKRICLVCDFNGQSATEILFELWREAEQGESEQTFADIGNPSGQEVLLKSSGLSGNTEQSEQKGQETTGTVRESLDYTEYGGVKSEVCVPGTTRELEMNMSMKENLSSTTVIQRRFSDVNVMADITPTLEAGAGQGGNNMPIVMSEGVDIYNGKITGNVTSSLTCNSNATSTQPILLESNQNHATVQTDGVSTALPASMGQGGGYVPMVVDEAYTLKIRGGADKDANGKTAGKGALVQTEKSGTLGVSQDQTLIQVKCYDMDNERRGTMKETEEMSPTLSARAGTGGNNVPCVVDCIGNGQLHDALCPSTEVCKTLNCMDDPMKIMVKCIGNGQADGLRESDLAGTLNCMHDQQAIAVYGVDAYNQQASEEVTMPIRSKNADTDHIPCVYALDRACFNQGQNAKFDISVQEDRVQPIVSRGPGAVSYGFDPGATRDVGDLFIEEASKTLANGTYPGHHNGVVQSVVRRLTPLECERLQGYPDNWTNIGEWIDSKGKKHKEADSPRYKALGNSIALPFWEWMAKRMVKNYDRQTEMASLFDGIGGFPLVYSRAGCKPIWASEIEEFPIAVTKIRFPEVEDVV